jgi:IclR family transcriptional regulator, blcABC operon repressor
MSNLCAALEERGLIRRADGGYLLGGHTLELEVPIWPGWTMSGSPTGSVRSPEVLNRHLVQHAMPDGSRVLCLAV